MIWIQRALSALAAVAMISLGVYFHRNIPVVGAVGEAVSIGGKFYPTDLVLWFMWLLTITLAGAFLVFAARPR